MRPSTSPIVGLLLVCFFLSGLAALIYQTAWTRQFAFVFGTSELAVASVLAAYMGGLALGAAVASRFAPRVQRPLLVYGILELAIGGAALCVPLGVRGAQALYVTIFGSQAAPADEGGLATALFYLASSFLILLVPTSLMGATLPLLARHAVRNAQELGSRIGLLYATNTAGAVAGTVLTGFFLLPAFGLKLTVWIAVATNGLVFAAAALLARHVKNQAAAPRAAEIETPTTGSPTSAGSWILPLILLSGAVSFTYEVLWTRLLGHIVGGSVYGFATMLATFLLGIALGSWFASGRAVATRESAAATFAWVQLGTAALSLGAYVAIDYLPDWIRALGRSDLRLLIDALGTAAILLPGTLCIGATFPLAVRILANDETDAAASSARVYAWNTVGAIVGAVGAGFFLIPAVGFGWTISAAVAMNLALGVVVALRVTPRATVALVAAAAVGLALLAVRPGPPWNVLRTGLAKRHNPGETVYYGVGRSSTVLLRRLPDGWQLSSNGLAESVIHPVGVRVARFAIARWLGSLPAWGRDDPKSLLVVGFGGGLVVESIPPSYERVEAIEIEPEVLLANRVIGKVRNIDPLADPRLRITINDARSALLLTRERYDAIVSQPSHPWTAAASHLYTREFFQLARDHLSDRGVFVQWMGLGFIDDALLRTLLATLRDVFPHVQLYQPAQGGVLFTGSLTPFLPERSSAERIGRSGPMSRELGIHRAEDIAATLLLDDEGTREYAGAAPINTDERNWMQNRSPRIAERGKKLDLNEGFGALDPLPEGRSDADWNRTYLVRRMLAKGYGVRALSVARSISNPADREAALALVDRSNGRLGAARAKLERALALDPKSSEARAALLQMVHSGRLRVKDREKTLDDLSIELSPSLKSVATGWALQEENRWEELAALEERLGKVAPWDPAFAPAIRLRAAFRLERGDVASAREAVVLIDSMLAIGGELSDLLLRARAATQARYYVGAASSVSELGRKLRPVLPHTRVARQALELVDAMPAESISKRRREGLKRMLRSKLP